MIKSLFKNWNFLRKNERGGVLIFVGLCLIPIILMVGLAVDSSFGLAEKRRLQMAADSAAKAGAVNGGGILSTTVAEAQKVFSANTVSMTNISGPNISFNPSTQIVTVTASVVVPTFFMQVAGIASETYNVTASAIRYGGGSEVAIVLDLSQTNGNWTSKIIGSLQSFITGLPSATLVSIVPIATQLALDPTTTNQGLLFNHLSNTTNDELANPAFYSLSNNYAWSATNYGNIYNYLYGNTFPTNTSYYPLPGTCTGWGGPGTYLACAGLYPALCSAGHTSCCTNYSYTQYTIPAILPLTANRTVLTNYLNTLSNFNTVDSNVLTSLVVWGWRTIDPQWKDFWLVNSDSTTTVRASGNYPQVYNSLAPKNLVLVVTGPPTLNGSGIANNYKYSCNQGKTSWFMTYYGIFPLTSDKTGSLDVTCDNYNYKTIDQGLGLNTSTTNYYNTLNTSTTYGASIVTEVKAKFLRICTNIKAQGINIYVITQNDDPTLQSCASSSASPFYQVSGNGTSHIDISATNVSSNINSAVAFQH